MIMTGGNQNEFESPFRTFEAVAKMFGKSAKTVGRWVQTIPGFPQPVRVGCSRLFLSDEVGPTKFSPGKSGAVFGCPRNGSAAFRWKPHGYKV